MIHYIQVTNNEGVKILREWKKIIENSNAGKTTENSILISSNIYIALLNNYVEEKFNNIEFFNELLFFKNYYTNKFSLTFITF